MADRSDGHAQHDPIRVAALVGADPESDDSEARGWVDGCLACADLYADLVALAVSTRAVPAQIRSRDFTLSAADAQRLTTVAAVHAAHDPILVAALVDRSLESAERTRAEALVASCSECAVLRDDLLTLADAVRAMPTPQRIRDHRLTEADAARLRPTGVRRLIGLLGGSHDLVTRPLAIGLTTLGLVGVLISGVPSTLMVGSAASTAGSPAQVEAAQGAGTRDQTDANKGPGAAVLPDTAGGPETGQGVVASPATVPAASAAGMAPIPAPVASVVVSPPDTADALGGSDDASPGGGSSGPSRTIVVSGLLFLGGLGLFAMRWGARRLHPS